MLFFTTVLDKIKETIVSKGAAMPSFSPEAQILARFFQIIAPRRCSFSELLIISGYPSNVLQKSLNELKESGNLVQDSRENEFWSLSSSADKVNDSSLVSDLQCPHSPCMACLPSISVDEKLVKLEQVIDWCREQKVSDICSCIDTIIVILEYFLIKIRFYKNNILSKMQFVKMCLKIQSVDFFYKKKPYLVIKLLLKSRGIVYTLENKNLLQLINIAIDLHLFLIPSVSYIRIKNKTKNKILDSVQLPPSASYLVATWYLFQGNPWKALEFFSRAPKNESTEFERTIAFGHYEVSAASLAGREIQFLSLVNKGINDKKSDKIIQSIYNVHMSHYLLTLNKKEESWKYISNAIDFTSGKNHIVAYFQANLVLTRYYRVVGNTEKAYDVLKNALKEVDISGVYLVHIMPYYIETLYNLKQKGFKEFDNHNINDEIEEIINGNNSIISAIALRIKTEQLFQLNGYQKNITDLVDNNGILLRVKHITEDAVLHLMNARLSLKKGNMKEAKEHAVAAWNFYSHFPWLQSEWTDDLLDLLPETAVFSESIKINTLYHNLACSLLYLSPGTDIFLSEYLNSICLVFNACCGCLIHKSDSKESEIIARYNIPQDFCPCLWDVILSEQSWGKVFLPIVKSEESNGGVFFICYKDNSHDYYIYIESSNFTPQKSNFTKYVHTFKELFSILLKKHFDQLKLSASLSPSLAEGLVYQSDIMKNFMALIESTASTDAPVLLYGESGTGKELIARYIHRNSKRCGNMVTVNLASIPEQLFESEMHGYEKGAFTGANHRKVGLLEMANGGTLFLDEIPDTSPYIQVKLLRLLQEKCFRRLGGNKAIYSDFRLIIATNKDLYNEVQEGRFRSDLFYRINVINLYIPPLRDRKSDIIPIAKHYINIFSSKYNKSLYGITHEEEKMLMEYGWPGNIRELRNTIEKAVILSKSGKLFFDIENIHSYQHKECIDNFSMLNKKEEIIDIKKYKDDLYSNIPSIQDIEDKYIQLILKITGGKIGGKNGAASLLGINRTTLYSKLKKKKQV